MSDDRLFTTSYRYEIFNPNAKTLRQALAFQESRIKRDETIADRLEKERLASNTMEVARWMTNLEEASEQQRRKIEAELGKEEVKLKNKELVMVRRAQLKNLLADDAMQYEKELNVIGKSFYKKRI